MPPTYWKCCDAILYGDEQAKAALLVSGVTACGVPPKFAGKGSGQCC